MGTDGQHGQQRDGSGAHHAYVSGTITRPLSPAEPALPLFSPAEPEPPVPPAPPSPIVIDELITDPYDNIDYQGLPPVTIAAASPVPKSVESSSPAVAALTVCRRHLRRGRVGRRRG